MAEKSARKSKMVRPPGSVAKSPATTEPLAREVAETEYEDAAAILEALGIPKEGITLSEFIDILTSNSMTIHLAKDAVKYLFSSYLNIPLSSSGLLSLFIDCFNTTNEVPRKARVISCLNRWIDFHWQEFSLEIQPILSQLKEFYSALEKSKSVQWIKFIQQIITKVIEKSRSLPGVPSIMDPNFFAHIDHKELKWRKLNTEDLVRQFTFYDEAIYQHIQPHDMIIYKPAAQTERKSMLDLFIFHFNRICLWAKESILNEPELKGRKKVVKKLLDIAEVAKDTYNFNLLFSIMAAFQANPIYRLKLTWGETRQSPQWLTLHELTTPERNYRAYRDHLKALVDEGKSVIPYLGVHLADLIHIQDGLPSSFPDKRVNFLKHLTVAKNITDLLKMNVPSEIQPKKDILHFIHSLKAEAPGHEEQLKKLSQKVEPRQSGPKKVEDVPAQRVSDSIATTTAQRTKKIIKKATVGFSDPSKSHTPHLPLDKIHHVKESPVASSSSPKGDVSRSIDVLFEQHQEHLGASLKVLSDNFAISLNTFSRFEQFLLSESTTLKDAILASLESVLVAEGADQRPNVDPAQLTKAIDQSFEKFNSSVQQYTKDVNETLTQSNSTLKKISTNLPSESNHLRETLKKSFGVNEKSSEEDPPAKKKMSKVTIGPDPTPIPALPVAVSAVVSTPVSEEDIANGEALCIAAWNGNSAEVNRLLALPSIRSFINYTNKREQTALYCAARQCHQNIVIDLLNAPGINVDKTSPGGTALHAASFSASGETTGLLLAAGANPKIKNKHELTARQEAKRAAIDAWTEYEEKGLGGLLEIYPVIVELKSVQAWIKEHGHSTTPRSNDSSVRKTPQDKPKPPQNASQVVIGEVPKSGSTEGLITLIKTPTTISDPSSDFKNPSGSSQESPSPTPNVSLKNSANSEFSKAILPPSEKREGEVVTEKPAEEESNASNTLAITHSSKKNVKLSQTRRRLTERMKVTFDCTSIPSVITDEEEVNVSDELDAWINEMLTKSADSADVLLSVTDGQIQQDIQEIMQEYSAPEPPQPQDGFVCQHCGKRFRSQRGYLLHMEEHNREKIDLTTIGIPATKVDYNKTLSRFQLASPTPSAPPMPSFSLDEPEALPKTPVHPSQQSTESTSPRSPRLHPSLYAQHFEFPSYLQTMPPAPSPSPPLGGLSSSTGSPTSESSSLSDSGKAAAAERRLTRSLTTDTVINQRNESSSPTRSLFKAMGARTQTTQADSPAEGSNSPTRVDSGGRRGVKPLGIPLNRPALTRASQVRDAQQQLALRDAQHYEAMASPKRDQPPVNEEDQANL